jgi:DNA-binding CsgD family transcriptional regulator
MSKPSRIRSNLSKLWLFAYIGATDSALKKAPMRTSELEDTIHAIATADKIDARSDALAEFVKAWGLENVSYLALNLPNRIGPERAYVSSTYSVDWQKHYAQKGYVDVDPVVRMGLGGVLPIDWSDIDRSAPAVSRFFGEAQELDVGRQGISVPIRGRNHELAIFSVTSAVAETEWRTMRTELMRDLMLVSYNFHNSTVRSMGGYGENDGRLSTREVSCLRWKALGKTDKDIGQILGISPSTVRFHLETARARLGAMNTIHAVSKAVALGVVTLTVEPGALLR